VVAGSAAQIGLGVAHLLAAYPTAAEGLKGRPARQGVVDDAARVGVLYE
jgi:hypothetical protein